MPKVMLVAPLIVTSRNGREKPDAMIYAGKQYAIPADSVGVPMPM